MSSNFDKMSFGRVFSLIYLLIKIIGVTNSAETTELWNDENFARFSWDCKRMPNNAKYSKEDDGFQIKIHGNPESYTPLKEYTVILENETPNKKFSVFYLVVESASNKPQNVGKFKVTDKILSTFSHSCPNTIMYTSTVPKSQIQVSWVAPGIDSECVVFKATVLDILDYWHQDEGRLTLQLCQGELDNNVQPEILEECCACEEAMYELVFECLWSEHTHPKDFPADRFRTNFSTIMGATHSADFRIWDYNQKASQGIAEFAEDGRIETLQTELKLQSDKIRTVIKVKGLDAPTLYDKTFTIFRTDKDHHLLSILSKLIPSPDWVVGVPALELCLKNCSWIHNRILNLFPIDIGIIEGITYNASKTKTIPQAPIRPIKATYPTHQESPFYNVLNPIAKIIITRQRLFQKDCTSAFEACPVTEWSPWSPCSSTCGKGVQKRARNYLNGFIPQNDCHLMEKQTCYTGLCNKDSAIPSYLCKVSEWESWSECTCGKVYRVRYRKYENPLPIEGCSIPLKEQEMCPVTPTCTPPQECGVTRWSEWTPCSATCGEGTRIRTRLIHNPTAYAQCNIELYQNVTCTSDAIDCDDTESTAVCMQPKEAGPCRGHFPRWYYDSTKRMCMTFIYGGCQGNGNRFERFSDCDRRCETPLRNNLELGAVDCQLTEWTEWSPCSRTCGTGRQERRRMVEKNAKNGGKPCPPKLVKRRKCEMPPCIANNDEKDCVYLTWNEWGPCSVTCGTGLQNRRREVNYEETPSDIECNFKQEHKYCYLPYCNYR
ncbi:spondin-1-like isoform X2 [Centruroides vittatus]|uniref:spondin-1-like isoform X2 n=1 Tax=Centruroides vittatus TaxID=120091 RepID=UPI003510B2C8